MSTDAAGGPPPGLLEDLLEQASHPGVKGRAAVPVRGAVTGARPVLSALLLLVGAAVGGGLGWATWRTGQWLRGRAAAREALPRSRSRRAVPPSRSRRVLPV